MNAAAFVVTLERASHRRAQVDRILSSCPWPCTISPAVDGSRLSQEEIDRHYQPNLYPPWYPHRLRLGEIGCFLSHRRLWQRMLDDRLDLALILEDDVELHLPEFTETLEFAARQIEPGDYLQFQVRDVGTGHPVRSRGAAGCIIEPRVTPLRTSAQLVTREAAEALLAASQPFDRPVDTFLQMRWRTGVRVKAVVPSNVTEVSSQLGGSTIGPGRKSILSQLRRELLRPLYRTEVAIWSLLARRAG